jgi:hypothetical protein
MPTPTFQVGSRDATLSLLDHQRSKFSLLDFVLIKTLEMTTRLLKSSQNQSLFQSFV